MKRLGIMASTIALASIGCAGPGDPTILYEEDFETTCDGAPCGWVQSGGADEAARYIETVPGDHGLELVGEDVFVRSPLPDDLPTSRRADALALRATARCDVGASIDVRVSIEEATSGRIVTFGTELVPEDVWGEPLRERALEPFGSVAPWQVGRVLGVSLLKTGPGTCEIDYVAVRTVTPGIL